MSGLPVELITPVVAILSGALVSVITKYGLAGWQKLVGQINSDVIKQVVVVVVAFGVVKLNAVLGVAVPTDPSTWTGDVIKTLVDAAVALGLHNVYKTTVKPAA